MERTYDATANRGELARALAIPPEKRCSVRCPQRISRSLPNPAALRQRTLQHGLRLMIDLKRWIY